MMKEIKIGSKKIGEGNPVFIIAEIGINHNGNIDIAKKLIDIAVDTGVDAVKFQKRTIDAVYSKEELSRPRESPWGVTNGEQKNGLEFGYTDYDTISKYCKKKGIFWFASCWDFESVNFIEQFDPPCYKIASSILTDDDLLKYTCGKNKPIIMSTGMSTIEEIDHAVDIVGKDNLVLLHCTSTYPSKISELNLDVINFLKERYDVPVGYSGHEAGITPTVAAVVIGACAVERHITLDRSMYGSDQSASLEPHGLERLVDNIREVPVIKGDGIKKIYESEMSIREKLRRR